MNNKILQPQGWKRPKGYSNGISAEGQYVFTSGVIGWNTEEKFEAKDFAGQFRQILINTYAILAEAGATPNDIVRMTCYVTDRIDYLSNQKEMGTAWREIFGKSYPCMTVVQIGALIEEEAKVEIETTAVLSRTN